jgi:hypothetical protein
MEYTILCTTDGIHTFMYNWWNTHFYVQC